MSWIWVKIFTTDEEDLFIELTLDNTVYELGFSRSLLPYQYQFSFIVELVLI